MIRIVAIIVATILVLGINYALTRGRSFFGNRSVAPVYPANIDMILAQAWTNPDTRTEAQVHFEATITGGDKKGQSVIARQFLSSSYVVNNKVVEEGDSIIVRYTEYEEENIWVFQQYNRVNYIIGLVAVFILLLFIFGGKKGFYTLLALMFTFLWLFLCFIPAILNGRDIYIATLYTCLFIVTISLVLVNGINYKTLSAAVGTLGGIVVSGVIFRIMDSLLQLTGIIDEEASYLLVMDSSIELKGIMFAGIVISALGASLDVGVSIASSLSELYKGKEKSFMAVFNSGISIGQDIISTMTNTLILVYVGSTLASTLLLVSYSNSFLELINRENIIFEILQALIGSIGVLFAIPITAAFYAFLHSAVPKKTKSKKKPNDTNAHNIPTEITASPMPDHLKKEKNPKSL